jgi:hypothetical protein
MREVALIVLQLLLAAGGLLAFAGYIRAATDPFGCREQMPILLLTGIAAIGFLALTVTP